MDSSTVTLIKLYRTQKELIGLYRQAHNEGICVLCEINESTDLNLQLKEKMSEIKALEDKLGLINLN